MTRILTILRTPGAMLLALLLALVAQLEHTAQVFSMVVGATGIQAQLHAYAFAVAVETAVLLFVLAGHRWISYGFAFATALTNLSYYAMSGINLFSVAALPAWLMSLLLPAAIVGYSHTIAEQGADTRQTPAATPVALPSVTTGHSLANITTEKNNDTANESNEREIDSARAESQSLGSASPQPTPSTPARKVRKPRRKAAAPTPAQRRAQITPDMDAAEVAAKFSVSVRTAQADIAATKSAVMQTNGVAH